MLTVYRQLLRLYPAAYRQQFGEEMLAVILDIKADNTRKKLIARTMFGLREMVGLITGAAGEHWRGVFGPDSEFSFSTRRFVMRDGFRFPKVTAVLMTLILGGVIVAIQKGEAIEASLPNVNPHIGPIQPVHSTLLPPIVFLSVLFYAAGLIGWAILFALRRSGVHRLETSGDQK